MPISDPTQHLIQLALLLAVGVALASLAAWGQGLGVRARRGVITALAVLAGVAVLAYPRMLQFHGYGPFGQHIYHYHDIYHYAIGAKYYPELGYDHLYNCTWVALQELREEGTAIPRVDRLLDLSSPNTYFDPRPRRPAMAEVCHDRFSPDRWSSLKADLRDAWLAPGFHDKWWQVMLVDLGFNPPPSWAVVGNSLTRVIPFTPTTLEWLPTLDMALIYGLGGVLVYQAFGPLGLIAYLTVFGCNWLASYRWTGGSFVRQFWFAALVSGVSLLQLKRPASAGVAFALSACLRLFPVVFAIGAVLALARDAREGDQGRRDLVRFVGAGSTTAAAVLLASLGLFDPALWPEFFEKMSHHSNTFFTWHVGFKKWAVYGPELFWAPHRYAAPGLQPSEAWQRHLNAVYDARAWLWDPLRGALSVASLWVAWRLTPARAAMLVGGVLMFCTSIPANYYYVYLAVFAAVFAGDARGRLDALRVALVFAMLVSVSSAPWAGDSPLVQNGWVNRTMFWFFALFVATFVPDAPGVDSAVRWVRERRGHAPSTP